MGTSCRGALTSSCTPPPTARPVCLCTPLRVPAPRAWPASGRMTLCPPEARRTTPAPLACAHSLPAALLLLRALLAAPSSSTAWRLRRRASARLQPQGRSTPPPRPPPLPMANTAARCAFNGSPTMRMKGRHASPPTYGSSVCLLLLCQCLYSCLPLVYTACVGRVHLHHGNLHQCHRVGCDPVGPLVL